MHRFCIACDHKIKESSNDPLMCRDCERILELYDQQLAEA